MNSIIDLTGRINTIWRTLRASTPVESFCDVVSTVGSGDAFLAGFLSGTYSGSGEEDALREAVACGAVVETAIPDMPRTLANPIRLSFAEQRVAHAAPALGEHGAEVLREAGLSAAEIAGLKSVSTGTIDTQDIASGLAALGLIIAKDGA